MHGASSHVADCNDGSVSWATLKKGVFTAVSEQFAACQALSKNGDCPERRPAWYCRFSENRKKGRLFRFTYTNYWIKMCEFRDQVERQTCYLVPRKVFPEGLMSSWRTNMSNTLAWNGISNWWSGMYPTCKKHQPKRQDETYTYIYVYNHRSQWQYKTTAIYYMPPPAAT